MRGTLNKMERYRSYIDSHFLLFVKTDEPYIFLAFTTRTK